MGFMRNCQVQIRSLKKGQRTPKWGSAQTITHRDYKLDWFFWQYPAGSARKRPGLQENTPLNGRFLTKPSRGGFAPFWRFVTGRIGFIPQRIRTEPIKLQKG